MRILKGGSVDKNAHLLYSAWAKVRIENSGKRLIIKLFRAYLLADNG